MSGKATRTSRRSVIKAGVLGAAALGGGIGISACKKGGGSAGTAPSGKKTLRIIQWNHFVPAFDKWFNGTYIKKWGDENDTEVTVDNVGIPALNPTAAAEVSSKNGHDLFGFLWPRPVYEEDVIDHGETYQECERRYGEPIREFIEKRLGLLAALGAAVLIVLYFAFRYLRG